MFAFAFVLTANASAPATNFAGNMMMGSTGQGVKELQMFLNACPDTALAVNGGAAGSVGNETTTFGPATKAAVMKYQAKVGVITTGNFYTLTRGQASTVGNMCGNVVPVVITPTLAWYFITAAFVAGPKVVVSFPTEPAAPPLTASAVSGQAFKNIWSSLTP
jgi:peptidoglycan hydrolase-like protein with peptidoglycan-binding domain